jgi:DNA polymerase III epsilon subunit-like protein
VIDLETTGLPGPGLQPRITEVAVQSFSRRSIEEASANANLLPRVGSKMAFCLNPGEDVEPKAAELTGTNTQLCRQDNLLKLSYSTLHTQLFYICAVEDL